MRRTIVALFLFAAAAAVQAETLRETVDRTFDVKPGATLTLENVNGGITIKSWDQPRIRIWAEKAVERTDAADAREALAHLKVTIQPGPNGVAVRTEVPRQNKPGFWDFLFGNFNEASVRYEVTVPRSANLDVENTNGAVLVSGVTGVLKIDTTNGRIELARCGGRVEASSTNGRVTAEMLTVDPTGVNRLETTNGRIEITLPAGVRADLDASTTNGSIDTQLPVTTRSIDKSSLRGSVNGGGADFRLRTTNGSIRIHASGTAAAAAR